jgi:glycosyltransferase involved in cell wall biosynthesis
MSVGVAAPLLTIAIPTYNRRAKAVAQVAFLHDALRDEGERVEFLVSDNCSTDGTSQALSVAFPVAEGGPAVHCNGSNVGLVGNLLVLIQRARGRYVWLIGDDDRLSPGIVAHVLERLVSGDVGLLFIDHQASMGGTVVMQSAVPPEPGPRDLLDVFAYSGTTMMFITACVYRVDALREAIDRDPEQRDRLAAPLYWSLACAARRGLGVLRGTWIDNVWGDVSWSASTSLVFDRQVPSILRQCHHLGYPSGRLWYVRMRYGLQRRWHRLRTHLRALRSRRVRG